VELPVALERERLETMNKSRLILAFLICFIAPLSSLAASQSAPPVGVTFAQIRTAHLRRGINLSNWFGVAGPGGFTKQHFETAITTQDLVLIHQMGFDYVRLPLDPEPMMRHNDANDISSDYLTDLDAALKMILDQNLSVIIDIHPTDAFKLRLGTDNAAIEQFEDFWRALAHHYSSLDANRVFFEILNEPELSDSYRWYGIEAKLADAIREGAPQHTIIAAGARWSDDDDLVFLEPLRDPNVIYNFHYYEPHLFTHQGATWAVNFWHYLDGLSYPSTPENAAKVAESVPDASNRLTIIRYGQDHWDAARIDADFNQVAEWAHRWNVPVICNELGVYRKSADPADRAKWITDVRTGLEKYGFGWAMWDYDGGFAVVNKQNGQTTPDAPTVKALGLTQ
jgi:endoglucanase